MKKKALAAIIIAMGICALSGCGDQKSPIIPESESIPPSTSSVVEESTTTPLELEDNQEKPDVITERTIVDGQMQSYLTGEWKDANVVQRRNFAIMIPNNKPALPSMAFPRQALSMKRLWRDVSPV